ncbi:phospho-sugar mutase, partial [Flavobacteriaceae bacterium]|nr:phospho-sugar mutase [Flavobacteriaceae bacterium]
MNIEEKVTHWLSSTFDQQTHEALKKLQQDPKKLEDAFYTNLAFGTGGMRGIMGVGTNRINKYTLGKNTQGLSNYLNATYPQQEISAVIAYDCRNNSAAFAKIVADVFTANGIKTYLFSDLRATPELSFAVRHLNAQCGIVLTASHNPPEYNGYKVYGKDGGQMVPPEDEAVMHAINAISFEDINFEAQEQLLHYIDTEVDNAYQDAIIQLAQIPNLDRSDLKIVFTSIHGTSITAIPSVLEKVGYKNIFIVEEQAQPDGNFPTVSSPNPE